MKNVRKQPASTRAMGWPAMAAAAIVAAATGLAGCASTNPNAPASTGAASGATAAGADEKLQTCQAPVGTVRLQDGMRSGTAQASTPESVAGIVAVLNSLSNLTGRSNTPSNTSGSLDGLRLLIQQSNCFVIVDRGLDESAADDEKQRTRNTKEARSNANMGTGQEVAADYVLRSSVISIGNSGSHGVSLGVLSMVAGAVGGASESTTAAKVQLVLADTRSKVQVAVSQGDGSGSNTAMASNVLGRAGHMLGGVGLHSESKTSDATILLQAFADAYNKMVPVLLNYKSQQVKGGLGGGGTLQVQPN